MFIAEQEGGPYLYFHEKVRKEDLVKQIAKREHIGKGLIWILSVLEPCPTFSFRSEKGKPFVAVRDFGLMHVRLQTWFPRSQLARCRLAWDGPAIASAVRTGHFQALR